MAESVVKLRVDSREYDFKIKRSAQNVLAFGENCRKAGQSMAKADKEAVDYVRSIGQMETVSKNAKGKINEMTNAFTDLSVQYKRLTDEEKASPFGQALSQSLDQLKGRINESKAQLSEVNSELGNTSAKGGETSSVLNELAGKFGLNITQAGAFGMALGAATTAAKVAKDAFFANEQQLDEWGRVVASSESVYRGFLDALNTGDISGFLGRISSIVSAARDAYDALDELATFNAFNQVNVARTRQQLMDAQNDYREGTGSKEQVRTAAGAYKAELDQRRQLEKNAYSKAITEYAKRRGVNPADLARVMLGSYGDYNQLKSMPLTGTRTTVKTNMYGQQWKQTTRVAANEAERMGEMLRRFNDTELQELQGLGAKFFQTGFEKGQIDRQVNRILNGRQGGAGGGRTGGTSGGRTGGKGGRGGGGGTIVAPLPVGSIAEQEAKVQALTKAWREASDQAGRDGYLAQLNEAKAVLEQMQGKTKVEEIIPEGSFKALNKELKDLMAQRELLSDPMDVAILDDQINEVREKIDELNGKTVRVVVEVPKPPTLEFQVRTKMAEEAIAADANALRNLLEVSIRNGIDGISLPSDTLERLFAGLDVPGDFMERIIRDGLSGVDIIGNLISGQYGEVMNVPDEVWQGIVDQINQKLKEKGLGAISLDMGSGNVSENNGSGKAPGILELTGKIARLTDGIGSITTGLEQLGIKIPEGLNTTLGVIQSLITVINGVQSVIQLFATTSQTANTIAVDANTVALGGLLSAMATNTLTNFIPFFAGGGIMRAASGLVGGNYMSGDNVGPVMVDSGELILNRAQQGNIASQLESGAGTIQMEARLYGEDIVLATRNVDRRRGKGEVVRSR